MKGRSLILYRTSFAYWKINKKVYPDTGTEINLKPAFPNKTCQTA